MFEYSPIVLYLTNVCGFVFLSCSLILDSYAT